MNSHIYGTRYYARRQLRQGVAAASSIPDPHCGAGGDAGGGDKPLLHLLASLHTQQQQVCATINQSNQIQASKHRSLMRTLEEQSKDLEVSCTALLCIKNISIVIFYQPEDETFPINQRQVYLKKLSYKS